MIGVLLCLVGLHYEQLEIRMIDNYGHLSRTCARCGIDL